MQVSDADPRDPLHTLARVSLGAGFQAMLLTAAALAAVSALLTWLPVRREETAAVKRNPWALPSGTFIPIE